MFVTGLHNNRAKEGNYSNKTGDNFKTQRLLAISFTVMNTLEITRRNSRKWLTEIHFSLFGSMSHFWYTVFKNDPTITFSDS